MKETFLVIGSNSFSGAHFVKHLLSLGHPVVGISRSCEARDVFLPYKWMKNTNQNFQYLQADINNNLDKYLQIISEKKPSYVVNFSAQGMVAQSWKTPEDWYQTNVMSQVLLHDQLRKFKHIKKYIHITTPEVYGSTSGWIKESNSFYPTTPYAVSRAACDMHLLSFFKAYNFPVVFTRAANVYGAGQQPYRLIPRTILGIKTGNRMKLDGGGESIRSFIHINDVVDATLKIALKGALGETYHISGKFPVAIKDLVAHVCRLMQCELRDAVQISPERLGKDQAYLLDSEKIRNQLGWEDLVTLDEGLNEVIEWVNQNIEELSKIGFEYVHKK